MSDSFPPPSAHTLYAEHHGWLKGWLRKKLGCRFEAEDLTHDTFLKLLTQLGGEPLTRPRAWLLVTANRLLINRFHHKRVEDEVLRAVAALVDEGQAPSVEELVANRQLLARVLVMLAEEVGEKPRRAFLMARVDGLSYREIAVRLQVSESSVKQYLAKVLAHCHARLHEDGAAP